MVNTSSSPIFLHLVPGSWLLCPPGGAAVPTVHRKAACFVWASLGPSYSVSGPLSPAATPSFIKGRVVGAAICIDSPPPARSFLLSLCPSPCQSPAAFCPRSCLLPADFLAAAGGQLELGAASRHGQPQESPDRNSAGTVRSQRIFVTGLGSVSLPIAPGSPETHKLPSCLLWGPREDGWGTHPHHDIAFLLGDGFSTPSSPGGNQPPAAEIALSILLIGLRANEPSPEPGLPGELCRWYRALEGDICVPGGLGGLWPGASLGVAPAGDSDAGQVWPGRL